MGVEVQRKEGIHVRGADGKLLHIEGVGYVYACDQDCTFWKRITEVVTTQGNHCLISLKGQKCMLLTEQQYLTFLERGKFSRRDSAKNLKNTDSGVNSGSESEGDNQNSESESEEVTRNNAMFAGDIRSNKIEVLEGQHVGHEAYL